MTNRQLAIDTWNTVKSSLEDRSVLQLGDVDEETLKELEIEQIETIFFSLKLAQQRGGQ